MEIYDSIITIGGALVGALVGGGLTGYFTLKATDKTIRAENEKENKRSEQEIDNLLDALGVELRTLWMFHMRRIGHTIEELPDNQPLEVYYPLTQDYFTIYHSNASLIGRIKDCALSEAIVVCYNKCKKNVDGFKYNNQLYREYMDTMPKGTIDDPRFTEAKRKALTDYAKIIKEDHFELKGYAETLLKLLDNRK